MLAHYTQLHHPCIYNFKVRHKSLYLLDYSLGAPLWNYVARQVLHKAFKAFNSNY